MRQKNLCFCDFYDKKWDFGVFEKNLTALKLLHTDKMRLSWSVFSAIHAYLLQRKKRSLAEIIKQFYTVLIEAHFLIIWRDKIYDKLVAVKRSELCNGLWVKWKLQATTAQVPQAYACKHRKSKWKWTDGKRTCCGMVDLC